jgi:hypothetical protein
MSDVSALSNQYETLIDTSDKVNNSIIALKKYFLKRKSKDEKYKALQLSEEDVDQASKYLGHFLCELYKLLDDDIIKFDDIPNIVVEDYLSKLVANIPTVKDDVRELLQSVAVPQKISGEQLEVLDRILMTLDGERKVLFRKLRSSRG